VPGDGGRAQAADHRDNDRGQPVQTKRGKRIEDVALPHGEHHGQRGGHLSVRDAAFIHNRQRGERGGKADKINLDQGEGAHPG